jgi:hypothetical protein
MTAPTLRQAMADVIADLGFTNGDELVIADALLASPELQAIIDLAAMMDEDFDDDVAYDPPRFGHFSPTGGTTVPNRNPNDERRKRLRRLQWPEHRVVHRQSVVERRSTSPREGVRSLHLVFREACRATVRRDGLVSDRNGSGGPRRSWFVRSAGRTGADTVTELICEFDECRANVTSTVHSIRGRERLCPTHAFIVLGIEKEWQRAEDEYLSGEA